MHMKVRAAALLAAAFIGLAAGGVSAAGTAQADDPLKGLIKPGMSADEIRKILLDAFPGSSLDSALDDIIKPGMSADEIDRAMKDRYPDLANVQNPLDGKIKPGMSQEEIERAVEENSPQLTGDNKLGCEGLLCLANPNGWKSVSECHPPVKEIFRRLRKRKPMPRCPQADESQNRIDFVYNPYDPCFQMNLNDVTGYVAGSGSRYNWHYSDQYAGHGTGYCGGKQVSSYRTCVEEDSEGYCLKRATVKVYDVLKKNPYYDPYSIDVTIEGKWRYRVHDN